MPTEQDSRAPEGFPLTPRLGSSNNTIVKNGQGSPAPSARTALHAVLDAFGIELANVAARLAIVRRGRPPEWAQVWPPPSADLSTTILDAIAAVRRFEAKAARID